MIGIYVIRNEITDECYIGQSVNISKRWEAHRANMKNKKYALYIDMRYYGLQNFSFSVLEECDRSELDEKEDYWIAKYQDLGFHLYNIKGVAAKEAAYEKQHRRYQKSFKKYR